MALLEVAGLEVGHVPPPMVRGVSLALAEGAVVVVLGRDGAGKTVLARTLAGLLPELAGAVVLGGQPLAGLDVVGRVRRGLVLVPQAGRLFPDLPVRGNLRAGAWTRREDPGFVEGRMRRCVRYFPALEACWQQRAGALPLVHQQMAAIARGLMADPKVLLVDEPSWGLGPDEVSAVAAGLRQVVEAGIALVILDRHVGLLDLADRALVLRDGSVAYNGPAGDLRRSPALRRELMGVAGQRG